MPLSRAVTLTAFGGYDRIKIEQIPRPKSAANHVVVEMKACGMNFNDIYTRQGTFTLENMKPPFIMGVEGAGVISEIGDEVTELKVGDRVMCWNFTYGMWAEHVPVPACQCQIIPESMSFEEAASIPINYITAYLALKDFGGLASGQSVLIQSAAGGVGWAATQIAHSEENVTVFGTSSASKHEEITTNGVNHAIDYQTSDFVAEVLRISPSGVNIVLDSLSGNDFMRSEKLLKHMGRLIHIGVSNMVTGEKRNILQELKVWWQIKNICLRSLNDGNLSICGLNIANLQKYDKDAFQCTLQKILQLYMEGKIKPRIDSVWSFDQVVEATDHMVNRKNIGKIILVPHLSQKK